MILNDDELNGLPNHDYKREASILLRVEERNKKGHELCDNLIMFIMKHRASGVKLVDEIRLLVTIREYDQAEEKLNELTELVKELRGNTLLKNLEKEIKHYL